MQIQLPINLTGLIQSADYRKIDGGRIYFGEADKDPRSYPVDTFLDKEFKVACPPFLSIKLGYLYHHGNIVNVHVHDDVRVVSILITDVYGRQLAYLSNHVVDICNFNPPKTPKKEKVNIYLQSKTYPSFEKGEVIFTSRRYSLFEKVDKYFTSTNYPYVFDDALTLRQSNILGGAIFNNPAHHDNLTLNHVTVLGINLKTLLSNHGIDDNLVMHDTKVIGGRLTELLKQQAVIDELNTHQVKVTGGELAFMKIVHHVDADHLFLNKSTCKGGSYE